MGTNTMIQMLKHAGLVLVAMLSLTLAISVPTNAQESEISPEHLALARRYIDLTDKSGVYQVALLETALETARTLLRQNPDLSSPVDDAISSTLEVYAGRRSDLIDQFARVYALTFSIEDLQEIVAFYETPAGGRLATANATINNSLQEVLRIFQVNLRTEFFAMVRAELRAAGHEL